MIKKNSHFQYFLYSLPSLPLAALSMPVYIFLPSYYADTLGLGLAVTGLVLFVTRIWDVVTDPVIGILGDRTRGLFGIFKGRRKPWMIMGMIPTLLGTWFLLVPPDGAGIMHLLVWSLILYLGWTAVILPLQAWGAELSPYYDERSKISAWREGLTVFGILGTLGLIAALGYSTDGLESKALLTIAAVTLILLPLTVGLACLFVPERPYLFENKISFREGLKTLVNNKAFRILILAYLINGVANGLPATLFIFYVKYALQMPDLTEIFLFIYFACGFIAVPLWLRLSFTYGKHVVWAGAMIWACVFFLMVPFIEPGDKWFYLAIVILTGLSLGADLVLPAAMQADVVDCDTLDSGQQRTGLYFALWSMSTKLSLAIAAGLAFPLLQLLGFEKNQPGTADQTLWPLIILYSIVPVILKLIAIFIMMKYPLNREIVEKNRQEIKEKWVEPRNMEH